jgi:hypothetical protein
MCDVLEDGRASGHIMTVLAPHLKETSVDRKEGEAAGKTLPLGHHLRRQSVVMLFALAMLYALFFGLLGGTTQTAPPGLDMVFFLNGIVCPVMAAVLLFKLLSTGHSAHIVAMETAIHCALQGQPSSGRDGGGVDNADEIAAQIELCKVVPEAVMERSQQLQGPVFTTIIVFLGILGLACTVAALDPVNQASGANAVVMFTLVLFTLAASLSLLSLLAVVGDQFDITVRRLHAPSVGAKCDVDFKLVDEFCLESTARAMCWQFVFYPVNTRVVVNVALTIAATLALSFLPAMIIDMVSK